jgi:hypothetical protein
VSPAGPAPTIPTWVRNEIMHRVERELEDKRPEI